MVPPAGEEAAFREALPGVEAVAGAIAFARDLANSPANEATPAWMEERARELAARAAASTSRCCGADELRARGMGGLLAVGAGSAHAPRMVRLRWGDRGPRVALVGKGVTFDTGGISIKPAAAMDEMKYDKSGACDGAGHRPRGGRPRAAGAPVGLRPAGREHARAAAPTGRATSCAATTARRWRSPTPTPRGG